MFTLDEQTRMVGHVIRQWCQTTLAPRIPALEAGAEQPFTLMKQLAKTFGFDAMLGSAVRKRIAKLRAAEVTSAAGAAGAEAAAGAAGAEAAAGAAGAEAAAGAAGVADAVGTADAVGAADATAVAGAVVTRDTSGAARDANAAARRSDDGNRDVSGDNSARDGRGGGGERGGRDARGGRGGDSDRNRTRDEGIRGELGSPMMMHVVVKELSRVSPGFAMGFGVTVGLVGGAIVAKGTADQIERWGLPLATLAKIGSWCLTEPGAGSDAFGSMRTTARREGDGFVLDGNKTFITNGPGADVFLVYAKLDDGVAAFIVEREMPGVTVGPPFKKMGMRDSPTSEVAFDGVRLGQEHLLGGNDRSAGRNGRSATKESLGTERSGVPAMAWGILERCYEASLHYVRERQQFGRPIGEFQAVQLKIADLYLKLRTVENVVFRLAWMQQHDVRDRAYINASKAMCAQLCVDAAMTAIQIHGGYGYMEELGLEKLARDAKLLELGAGTTDINLLAAARELIGGGDDSPTSH